MGSTLPEGGHVMPNCGDKKVSMSWANHGTNPTHAELQGGIL